MYLNFLFDLNHHKILDPRVANNAVITLSNRHIEIQVHPSLNTSTIYDFIHKISGIKSNICSPALEPMPILVGENTATQHFAA